jgi:hypothetical protein
MKRVLKQTFKPKDHVRCEFSRNGGTGYATTVKKTNMNA